MAIDVFTEEYQTAAYRLSSVREAKLHWGRALVRTDLTPADLDFLSRSFRGCVEREAVALQRYRDASGVLRGLSRRR